MRRIGPVQQVLPESGQGGTGEDLLGPVCHALPCSERKSARYSMKQLASGVEDLSLVGGGKGGTGTGLASTAWFLREKGRAGTTRFCLFPREDWEEKKDYLSRSQGKMYIFKIYYLNRFYGSVFPND